MSAVLITGAAGGIGSALCRKLSARGDAVIAVCRKPTPELSALPLRVEAEIDLTDDADVQDLAHRLGDLQLDRIILNAGMLGREQLGQIGDSAMASIRQQLELNALAPLRIVDALLPRLREGAKIALITSRMGSMGDNTSGGYYGYRMSKAAMNAMGKSLAEDLRGRGIAVFLLHPGYVRTAMTGGSGDVSADESAASLIERLDQLGLEQTGTFWHANGTALPW